MNQLIVKDAMLLFLLFFLLPLMQVNEKADELMGYKTLI